MGTVERALVVEGSAMRRTFARERLDALGLANDGAANGVEAIQHLSSRTYTHVILAERLPDMEAVDVIHWTRQTMSETPHFLVITEQTDRAAMKLVGDQTQAIVVPGTYTIGDLRSLLPRADTQSPTEAS